MKCLVIIGFLTGAQAFGLAAYKCKSTAGTQAELKIMSEHTIHWFDKSHSASSVGAFVGREKASYSDWKSYLQFRLKGFYATNDSSYVLALESLKGRKIKTIIYFDNDDHPEEIEEYICLLN